MDERSPAGRARLRSVPGLAPERDASEIEVTATSSTWTYADPESCAWWGRLWADRCELSEFGRQAVA